MDLFSSEALFSQGERAIKEAFHFFVQSVFIAENDTPLAKKAMEKALLCYKILQPKFCSSLSEDIKNQYFASVRHFEDHQDKGAHEVKEQLNRYIPHSTAESFVFGPQSEGKTGNKEYKIKPFTVSIEYAQGIRETMEDIHLLDYIKVGKNKQHTLHLFAVLDGHGGTACAQFTRERLPKLIKEEFNRIDLFKDVFIYNALAHACIRVDEEWKMQAFQQTYLKDYSGTTLALACFIDQKKLWTVNVGDSGIVYITGDEVVQLTELAKQTVPFYASEIIRRGGFILYDRVDGNLDMARSIGDIAHPSISARPSMKKVILNSTEKQNKPLLIIACDGLWSVVTPNEAAQAIKGKEDDASRILRELAYKNGSTDNVTVLIVRYNWQHR